jgi:hypothetical protein
MNARATSLLCLLVLGCRVQEPDHTVAPHPVPTTTSAKAPAVAVPPTPVAHDSTAPLLLVVEGPIAVQAKQEIEVTVRLTRRPAASDVKVHLTVPAGASLIDSAADFTFTPSEGQTPQRKLRVSLASVPTADLVVEATAGGTGWGVRAERAYRFGRPEPMLPSLDQGSTPMPLPAPKAQP